MPTIELTKEEAELFKRFRKYQDEFGMLSKRGVFSMKGAGEITLSYNKHGQIGGISVKRYWKAR